jgi:hypothetical protein
MKHTLDLVLFLVGFYLICFLLFQLGSWIERRMRRAGERQKVEGEMRQIFVSAECPFCNQININSFADYDKVPTQIEINCKHWRGTNIKKTATGIVFFFSKDAIWWRGK